MGYPRIVQTLIVEDDAGAKEYYEAALARYVEKGRMAPPKFAFNFEDGIRLLDEEKVYHLVILDLGLPEKPGQPPSGVNFGLNLLDRCVQRNSYPIPAMLVISGMLQKANQNELDGKVRDGFAYGRVLVKAANLEDDLAKAIAAIERYCDIGIRIADGGAATFPTVSPRDEDLLRRLVMREGAHVGLDLAWWSAEYSRPTGTYKDAKGWTKTLMGRLLMGKGIGASRPSFFKLTPAGGAPQVQEEARILMQKLSHVKVVGDLVSGDRSLLVTQKVGDSNDPPVSLSDLLRETPNAVQPQLASIVQGIAQQISSLGDVSPDKVAVPSLLWKWHNKDRLEEQWRKHSADPSGAPKGLGTNPAEVLGRLQSSKALLAYRKQSYLHGDLNISNVAIDRLPAGSRAYIFDASGCGAGVNVRDLAMLEVTAVLHQKGDEDELVRHCAPMYEVEVRPSAALDLKAGSDYCRNTLKLVAELRNEALGRSSEAAYALMVFDCALIQLGGLQWPTMNKVVSQRAAAVLASLTGAWLLKTSAGALLE